MDSVNNTANLQYTRPFDRGYLTDWEAEHQIWVRAFGASKAKVGNGVVPEGEKEGVVLYGTKCACVGTFLSA